MPDVFISYKVSPGTSALVRGIADELESMGISCWYAPRNTDPGAFVPSILAAIDRCKVFVMVLDEGANNSGYVFNETVEAWKRYYREKEPLIIPFKVGEFEAARELSFYLSAFHIVNGGASVETANTEELIRKTSGLFHKAPTETVKSSVAPHPATSDPPPEVAQPKPQPAPPPAKIIKRGECGDEGDNVTFTLDENDILTISGVGAMRDMEAIDSTPWQDDLETISHIEIEDAVTYIGNYAFYDCAGLESVAIPDSVTEIGESAFSNCTWLESVTIPNSVTEIGEAAFQNCERLKSVTIPNSVTEIGKNVFQYCEGLEEVYIPDSVTKIGDWAFDGCKELKSVTIPNSVIEIGEYAFSDCIVLTSVIIPDSVTSIGEGAFWGCDELESISIPAKLYIRDILPYGVRIERRA